MFEYVPRSSQEDSTGESALEQQKIRDELSRRVKPTGKIKYRGDVQDESGNSIVSSDGG